MNTTQSEKLYAQALDFMPGGVNSPVRACRSVGRTPLFIDRAEGSKIYDIDGNEFIDYICSWGPNILGHKQPNVIKAVTSTDAMTADWAHLPYEFLGKVSNDIINLGILAHIDAGKTSVTENLLFASGATEKCGCVDNGDTITDSMDIEKRRGITVRASTTSIIWKYTLILHPKIAI